MDRELPPEVTRNRRIKIYFQIVVVVILLAVAFLTLRAVIRPTISRGKLRTAVAEYGPIEATLTASGTVIPIFEQVLISPIQARIDTVFARAGDSARAGISVVRLNLESILMEHRRLTDELKLLENQKEQLNLRLERTQIESQSQFDIKTLQTQFQEAELERVGHLLDIGGATKADQDQAKLNVDIARRELQQLSNQLINQQATLNADLKELELRIRIQNGKINEIERQIRLAEAKPDRDGVITWVNDDIGANVNPGDIIARIADLNSFRIQARTADVHATKLVPGREVRIRVDSVLLPGRISSVDPSVENGVASFLVELDNPRDQSLRSSLRVDVYVVTSSKDNVIRVANGPFYSGSADQKVFVVDGDRAVHRDVTIGASNYDYVELIGDINAGDLVVVSNMDDYSHMDEVHISD